MSVLKIRNSQVFHLEKIVEDEFTRFLFEGHEITRVRIFGIVVSKFDKFDEANKLVSSFLTLDDGSATISVRIWDNENLIDNGVLVNLAKINVGDICDLTGRVREYESERYILLENISGPKSIKWEMKQRLLLLKQENEWENQNIDPQVNQILDHFSDNHLENTPDLLATRSGLDIEKVQRYLSTLYDKGLVLCPSEGYFKKVE